MNPSGAALFDLQQRLHFRINAVGLCIWSALEAGTINEDEIAREIATRFGIDVNRAAADVQAFIQILLEKKLLIP